jgi:hypothetical protein
VSRTRELLAVLVGAILTRPYRAAPVRNESHGDVALHAERVDDHMFAVDLFPL